MKSIVLSVRALLGRTVLFAPPVVSAEASEVHLQSTNQEMVIQTGQSGMDKRARVGVEDSD
jgi:hypothetical protein